MPVGNVELIIRGKELELKKLFEQEQVLRKEIEELKLQLTNDQKNTNSLITIDEKLKIFTNYFKGRDDVYPYLSIDKNDSSKKYYIPACINEWKKGICNKTKGKPCKTCQYRENKPIILLGSWEAYYYQRQWKLEII